MPEPQDMGEPPQSVKDVHAQAPASQHKMLEQEPAAERVEAYEPKRAIPEEELQGFSIDPKARTSGAAEYS